MFATKHPVPVTVVLVLLLAVTVQLVLATHATAEGTEDNGGLDPPLPPGGGGETIQTPQVGIVDVLIAKLPWLLRIAMI